MWRRRKSGSFSIVFVLLFEGVMDVMIVVVVFGAVFALSEQAGAETEGGMKCMGVMLICSELMLEDHVFVTAYSSFNQ